MDLRPERLALAPVRVGLKVVRNVGRAVIESVNSRQLVERLQAEEIDAQLGIAAQDVTHAHEIADSQLLLMQSRTCAKIVARGLIQALNNPEEPFIGDRVLLLKRIMVEDLGGQIPFDGLLLEPVEVDVLRQYLPDF